jgi:hypothetical protein
MDKAEIKKRLVESLVAYFSANVLVSGYLTLKNLNRPGAAQPKPLASFLGYLGDFIVTKLKLGLMVGVGAYLLRDYENYNWLISGLGIGFSLHILNLLFMVASGHTGQQIGTFTDLLGSGLKLPVTMGIVGQVIQNYGIQGKATTTT